MFKLIAMSVFIAVGAIVGSLFYQLTGRKTLSRPHCIGLGILGAFAGLLLADLADIRLLGNLLDGLLFSSIGSLALLTLNLLLRSKNQSSTVDE